VTLGVTLVTMGVTLSRSVCVRHIGLGGAGNALYPVLSSWYFFLQFSTKCYDVLCNITQTFYAIAVFADATGLQWRAKKIVFILVVSLQWT